MRTLACLFMTVLVACDSGGDPMDLVDASAPDALPVPPDAAGISRVRWTNPTPVVLGDVERHADASLTEDQLTIYFVTLFNGNGEILSGTRESLDAPWAISSVPELSTSSDETSPFVSPDGLVLWFVRGAYGEDSRIIQATRTSRDEPWGSFVAVGSLNSARLDTAISVTPSLTTAVIASDRDDGDTTIERDVYIARRASPTGPWDPPVLVAGIDDGNHESDPALSSDELELYYYATVVGEAAELRVAVRESVDEDFTRYEPVAELNELGIVGSPWISHDGRTLYFSVYDAVANNTTLYTATR